VPRKRAETFIWFGLNDEGWARVDAIRGDMPRRVWVRAAFFAQLEQDEQKGTVAGMTPEENPFDGGMPFGLPKPDPYDEKNPTHHTRPGRRNALRKQDAATELRHIQVIHLANQGLSHKEIGEITGYKAEWVARVIRKELRKYEMASVQQYREFTLRKMLELLKEQEKTIRQPGFITTVTGAVATGPGGEALIDKGERTRAITEARKIVESIRREVGTDAPTQRHETLELANVNNILRSVLAGLAVTGKNPLEELEGAVEAEIIEDASSVPPDDDDGTLPDSDD